MRLICDYVSERASESRFVGVVTLGLCDVTFGSVHLHSGGRRWGDWRVKMIAPLYTNALH